MILDFIILGFFVLVIFSLYFIFEFIDQYTLPDHLLFILAFLTFFLIDFIYLNSFSKDFYLCFIFIILIEFINIAIIRNGYLKKEYEWNTRNLTLYNIFLDSIRIILNISTVILLISILWKVIYITP